MIIHRFSNYWQLVVLLGLILGGFTPAAANPSVQQWDQGLALIDENQTLVAIEYFYGLFDQQPHRLDLLDACFRAESRRSHADSVQNIVKRRVISVLPAGGIGQRFFQAKTLRKQKSFFSAADSFQELAEICRRQGNFLSALTATQMACRCWFDSKDSTFISFSRQAISQASELAAEHPRLQIESKIIVANTHFLLDELNQAEPLYNSVMDSAQAHGYRELEMDIANALGGLMSKQRRQDEALQHYQQAHQLALELGDSQRLCLVLTNLGYEETHQRQFDQARTHLTEAGTLAHEWGFHSYMGPIQSGLGALAEMSGDRPEAVKRFRAAVILSKQAEKVFVELGSRQRLAYNLAMMGQYTEAQIQYETCLEILDRTGGKFILNWVLGGLALTNHKLGYLDRAAELYRRAHAVNIDMGDRMSAAWCLNSLGMIEGLRGDYRQALISHHQAWKQYTELGDIEGAGYALASSAEVYLQLGDYNEALEHCQSVLKVAEEIGSEELLRKTSQIMATIYSVTGKPGLAELNFLRVIDIARRWDELVVEIWALNGLADHYLSEGRKEEARGCLQTALDLMGNQDYYHVRSEASRLLGRIANSTDEAVQWATQATELASEGGLPDLEWKALSDMGAYYFRAGQMQKAESSLKQSVILVESLRRQAGSDELRRHMLRPALQPYERLVQLYTTGLDDPANAFVTSERSRSQILASRLQTAMAHSSTQHPRTSFPEERGLVATITFLQSRLQEANLGKAVRDSLRGQISGLENEFAQLKLQWSAEEEKNAAVLFPKTPDAGNLQMVLKPGEHLLSYFLGTEQSFLFSVNRTNIKTYLLPPRHLLEEKVQLYLHLQKHAADGATSLPAEVLTTARQELYSLLIAPCSDDFSDASTLVFVPDGLLHRLPFAYLHNGEDYLFECNELFTAPSLQILGYLRQGAQDSSGDESPLKILAIGCAGSESDNQKAEERLHPFTDTPIPSLPQADEEVWRLAKLFEHTEILTGNAANESNIRSGVLTSADIIHIAAHSYADEVDSRRSYILLNRISKNDPEKSPELFDGLLLWHEIVGLDLNASLVTLASCRSAGGMLTTGEGITGLTQAFLLAGSRCVLASQTDVPDLETSWFMDLFYRELRSGSSAAASLRTVRLKILENSEAMNGSFSGGGFVLTGDGAVAYGKKSQSRLMGSVFIGLLVVGFFVVSRFRNR